MAAYGGFKFGAVFEAWQSQKLRGQEQRLLSLYQELDEKIRQINYLSVELEVEQNANAQMQNELLQLRQESFELRRELSFYQKVVAPELLPNGISVEQFDITPTTLEGRYKFRFALVQTDTQKRNATGYIRLKLNGNRGGSMVSLDFAELAGMSSQALKFSFHYFQYFEGEFAMPSDLIPETLDVRVIQPKTRWQPYKSFNALLPWPEMELSTD